MTSTHLFTVLADGNGGLSVRAMFVITMTVLFGGIIWLVKGVRDRRPGPPGKPGRVRGRRAQDHEADVVEAHREDLRRNLRRNDNEDQ